MILTSRSKILLSFQSAKTILLLKHVNLYKIIFKWLLHTRVSIFFLYLVIKINQVLQ